MDRLREEALARDRLSLVGHAAMPVMGPLELDELDVLLDEAELERGRRVLDLGAGRGDVALRCVSRHGMLATLVDRSPVFAAEATARAGRTPGVEIVCEDAARHVERWREDVALAVCLGATAALGGIESAARALERALVGGGAILVGDLVALGPAAASALELPLLDGIRPPGRSARRLILGRERVAAYERRWAHAIEQHLTQHPNDPGAAWARGRLGWMASLGAISEELAYAVWLLR
jgi:SAM-dependent methyltransferase